jgi:hypothetical protein
MRSQFEEKETLIRKERENRKKIRTKVSFKINKIIKIIILKREKMKK